MPELILAYLLIPFGLIVAIALLFFFFNLFHIQRYAIKSQATTWLALSYCVLFLILLGAIATYLSLIDWSQTFLLSDLLPSFESSSRL